MYICMHAHVENGLISKIQTDTYRRELERYGANSIEVSESLFYIDSLATLHLLNLIEGEEGEQIRWQFAVRSVDEFLNNFQLDDDQKLALLERLKNGFIQEHSTSKEFKLQLDTKFRSVRKQVEDILNKELNIVANDELQPLIDLLKWKSEQLQPLADQILELESNQQLQVPLTDLLASYTHMMINRIFKARQRTYEMLIYDLLYRYYKSLIGREKSKKKESAMHSV